MSESLQHKLDRVRRPRVQITYDVETGGAMEQKELPFVVGCLADLSGDPAEPQKALKDRSFTPVDRDNFNDSDGMHDWVLANQLMARVLAEKGYKHQFVFARNAGHCDRSVKLQTLPQALEWLWKD